MLWSDWHVLMSSIWKNIPCINYAIVLSGTSWSAFILLCWAKIQEKNSSHLLPRTQALLGIFDGSRNSRIMGQFLMHPLPLEFFLLFGKIRNSVIEERVERLTKICLCQPSRNKVDWPPSGDWEVDVSRISPSLSDQIRGLWLVHFVWC